jgi:hypothetical protein
MATERRRGRDGVGEELMEGGRKDDKKLLALKRSLKIKT